MTALVINMSTNLALMYPNVSGNSESWIEIMLDDQSQELPEDEQQQPNLVEEEVILHCQPFKKPLLEPNRMHTPASSTAYKSIAIIVVHMGVLIAPPDWA